MPQMLVLWLLSEGALHGYRIKRILDEPSLRFWFALEVGSIYSVLATLTKGGYVEEEAVEREGRRPERVRFRITPAGRQRLRELVAKAIVELPPLSSPINVALAATSELGLGELEALTQQRREGLQERLTQLDRVADSAPDPAMVSRLRRLTEAELKWLEAFQEENS
jgi:DNA-binding PadR family transcriptional regulator